MTGFETHVILRNRKKLNHLAKTGSDKNAPTFRESATRRKLGTALLAPPFEPNDAGIRLSCHMRERQLFQYSD